MKCPKCHFENLPDANFCSKCAAQLASSEEVSIPLTKTLETPLKELTRGTTFAERYEFIEELGVGGMGRVYKVFDKKINEDVALKILKSEISEDEKTIERFGNELKFTRKIVHKNVCRMYDINEEKGTQYITMEYVPGEDLKSTVVRVGQLSVGKAVSVAKQVCEGLIEAHKLGVVHRDLKPQNIMIDKEGNVRIMDFGIARSLKAEGITDDGIMVGTPEYMSPEQVKGEEADHRSDIYSLGVLLYVLLTGVLPFDSETLREGGVEHIRQVIRETDPKTPSTRLTKLGDEATAIAQNRRMEIQTLAKHLRKELEWIPLKAMRKERSERYRSASELADDIENYLKGAPLIAEPPSTVYRLKKFVRRNHVLVGGIAAVMATILSSSLPI